MKRKLDKQKIYALIGQAVVYAGFNLMWTVILVFGFLQMTVYR